MRLTTFLTLPLTIVISAAAPAPPQEAHAGAARRGPDDRCEIQLAQVCSAQQQEGDPCDVDDTRWIRATLSGACGPRPPAWSVSPGHPDGWTNGWHRDRDAVECGEDEYGSTTWCAARAWLRGPAGSYVVRATAEGGQVAEIHVVLGKPTPLP